MNKLAELGGPLVFRPVYQTLVWGGRRLERWRRDLPGGPVGEAWDVSDHERGMSVVATGPLAGKSLRELMSHDTEAMVGEGFRGEAFPLMVKLIDAADRLSVQVHPDDALARKWGLGKSGKTECWLILEDGGELYQGTKAGVDRAAFERALAAGDVAGALNRYPVKAGDFFLLEARTVHALGAGCLLVEVQQTCDVTFRVHDWNRPGLDGKMRPLHLRESLETIAFDRGGFGPRRPAWEPDPRGGERRGLVDGPPFIVEERRSRAAGRLEGGGADRCSLITCLYGGGDLVSGSGRVALQPLQTALVPAAAGRWRIDTPSSVSVLVSAPMWGAGSGAGAD